jgi:hypothetical protein
MERNEQSSRSRKQIFINNFLGGMAWALGATIGLALIAVILTLILKNISLIPVIGNFVAEVIRFVVQKNPNLFAR